MRAMTPDALARSMTHLTRLLWSSRENYPRSSDGALRELAAMHVAGVRFRKSRIPDALRVVKWREVPRGRETSGHLALKLIGQNVLRHMGGDDAELEMPWGAGRVDVGSETLKRAIECGDTSATRVVDILLEGWAVGLMPFNRRAPAIYWHEPNDTTRAVLDRVRERREASMLRAAAILDFGGTHA